MCPRNLQCMIFLQVQVVQVALGVLAGHHSLYLADQVVPEVLVGR